MQEFNTLQEFMACTKGAIYLLIVAMLVGLGLFWVWLTARDKEYD